jgi:hypothetical protein
LPIKRRLSSLVRIRASQARGPGSNPGRRIPQIENNINPNDEMNVKANAPSNKISQRPGFTSRTRDQGFSPIKLMRTAAISGVSIISLSISGPDKKPIQSVSPISIDGKAFYATMSSSENDCILHLYKNYPSPSSLPVELKPLLTQKEGASEIGRMINSKCNLGSQFKVILRSDAIELQKQ